jgi:hypothetical protein
MGVCLSLTVGKKSRDTTMTWKSKTIAAGIITAGASLVVSPVSAADRKNYSASFCDRKNDYAGFGDQLEFYRGAGISNKTPSGNLPLPFICPIARDNTEGCFTDFDVNGEDRHSKDGLYCGIYSYNTLTGSTFSYGWKYSGADFLGNENLDWAAASSCYTGQHAAYELECSVPVSSPNGASRLYSYSISE